MSLLKFCCLGTSCLLLEGEKKKDETEREKVKEEIKMPKGSSIRICSFSLSNFFLLLSRAVVLHIVLCPICYRRHALLIICTHPSNRFSFFPLSLSLFLFLYCLFSHTYRHTTTSYSNDNDSNVVS